MEELRLNLSGDVTVEIDCSIWQYRASGWLDIENLSADELPFEEGENPLRLGWRLIRDGLTVTEGRLAMPQKNLPGLQTNHVPFDFTLSAVSSADYVLLFSLVHENKQWLVGDGPSLTVEHEFELNFLGSPFEDGYWEDAAQIMSERTGLASAPAANNALVDTLFKHDFCDAVTAAIERALDVNVASESETRLLQVLAAPGTIRANGQALPRGVEYYHSLQPLFDPSLPFPTKDANPADIAHLFRHNKWVRHLFNRLDEGSVPALGSEDLPSWILGYRLSNMAIQILGKRGIPLTNRTDASYRFIYEIAVPEELPRACFGDSLISFMQSDVITTPAVAHSRYFHEMFNREGYVDRFEGLDDPSIAFSFLMFLEHAGTPQLAPLFGTHARRYWSSPADPGQTGPTRFEVALWTYDRNPSAPRGIVNPFTDLSITAHYADHPLRKYPILDALFTQSAKSNIYPLGAAEVRQTKPGKPIKGRVCLVGLRRSETGLGQNFRMLETALAKMGLLACVVDVEPEIPVAEKYHDTWDTTIVAINAENVPSALTRLLGRGLIRGQVFGFFLWEIPAISELHKIGVECVDQILVPTSFVGDIFAEVTDKPIINIGKFMAGLENVPDIAPRPSKEFTFLTSFDSHSGLKRKNPLAIVRAFQQAFNPADYPDVHLVLKTTELLHDHWGDRTGIIEEILATTQSDPRVSIRTGRPPFSEYLTMIQEADCLVSSSYAEGFGYLMAYSLWFGIPLIANRFGGHLDFCNDDTSFLTNFKKVDVERDEFLPRIAGGYWAEADVDDLASQMQQVVSSPKEAQKRAQNGRNLMRNHYSFDAFCDRLLDALDLSPQRPDSAFLLGKPVKPTAKINKMPRTVRTHPGELS